MAKLIGAKGYRINEMIQGAHIDNLLIEPSVFVDDEVCVDKGHLVDVR